MTFFLLTCSLHQSQGLGTPKMLEFPALYGFCMWAAHLWFPPCSLQAAATTNEGLPAIAPWSHSSPGQWVGHAPEPNPTTPLNISQRMGARLDGGCARARHRRHYCKDLPCQMHPHKTHQHGRSREFWVRKQYSPNASRQNLSTDPPNFASTVFPSPACRKRAPSAQGGCSP